MTIRQLSKDEKAVFYTRNFIEAKMLQKALSTIGWRSVEGNEFNELWLSRAIAGKGIRLKKGKCGSLDFYKDKGFNIYTFDDIAKNATIVEL